MQSVLKPLKLSLVAIAMVFAILSGAQAGEPIYTGTFSNKAVGGYDTVAYFKEGKAVKGREEFKTD